jgi:hypothetical protein
VTPLHTLNWTVKNSVLPITNNSGTAPRIVGVETIVEVAEGDFLDVMAKAEVEILEVYNVLVGSYLQSVWNGQPPVWRSRPMGENVTKAQHYRICLDPGRFWIPAGVTSVTLQHVFYSASSAYVPTDPAAIIKYADMQVLRWTPEVSP